MTIEALKSINYKDLGMRALWTFLEGFLGVLLIGIEPILDALLKADWNGAYILLIAALFGALLAGLSALKTLIVGVIKSIKSK